MIRVATVFFAVLIGILALGCSDANQVQFSVLPADSSSNASGVPCSREQKLVLELREAIDDGNHSKAMRIARGLIDTTDVKLKLQVIDHLGWMGKRSIPELVECINDPDERISNAALSSWEMAVADYTDDRAIASAVVRSVRNVKNDVMSEQMLLTLTHCDSASVTNALAGLIRDSDGALNASARQIYYHVSGLSLEK